MAFYLFRQIGNRLEQMLQLRRWLPLNEVQWANLNLLRTLVRRDLASKYKGSVLGNLWPIISQLSTLLIFTYVFSVILQIKLNLRGLPQESSLTFGLWLFAGLVPWTAFSNGIIQGATSVINNSNLVKKVVFPLSLLPIIPVLSSFFESMFGLFILIGAVAMVAGNLHVTLALFPLIWLTQLCFTTGLAYFVGALSVFLRDIPQALNIILMLWLYSTPILYPAEIIPQPFDTLIYKINPMAVIVQLYRDAILTGTIEHNLEWIGVIILSLFLLSTGVRLYRYLSHAFADVL